MILNIYKARGMTSFSVVRSIRYITKEKKVGHAGTLDPFAEGVLIIGTGKDTKNLTAITNDTKTYIASIKLGVLTNTLDTEGKIIKEKKIPRIDSQRIKRILNSFLGDSMQEPPMFSAKKIDGKKLYELARKNIIVKRNPVKITIDAIELLDYNNSHITFSVTVSKGTYIRVLGKNIAEKLGTVGHLDHLIRTRVGSFLVNDSKTIDNIKALWKSFAH